MTKRRFTLWPSGQHSAWWSLVDQAIISLSNFATVLIIVKAVSIDVFGSFALAQIYIGLAGVVQVSLIIGPMLTAVPGAQVRSKGELLAGFAAANLALVVPTVLGVLCVSWALGRWSQALDLGNLTIPTAAAAFAMQSQDWCRRACLADGNARLALSIDFIAYGGQFAGLVLLVQTSQVSPDAALFIIAMAFVTSATVALVRMRLVPSATMAMRVIAEHWRAGAHLLAAGALQWVGASGVLIFGGGYLGVHALGAVRAIQNLAGPLNVILQWMDNVIPVRCASHMRHGREHAMSFLMRSALAALAISIPVFIVILVYREAIVTALLKREFAMYAALLPLFGLYYVFAVFYRLLSYFFRVWGWPRGITIASFTWALISWSLAPVLIESFSENGMMYSLIAGEVCAVLAMALCVRAADARLRERARASI